ncbi:ATP-binding cassette domain-containing protein, partial [candidate division WOR-3 bacterium]|nr:ATP-binding cassette domain-containing protein [candidate division WOR-3 bacterium]
TNHLDLPSIKWLGQYLLNSKKNAIIVSHDREFLDTLCTRTIEISRQKLNKFKGNYSFYKIEKEKIIEKEKQELSNLLEQEKQLIAFINKWKAKESKVAMAQSREKILVKVRDRINNIHIIREKDARFNYNNVEVIKSKTGINGIIEDKSYDKANVLRNVEIDINPVKKIFLIGRNGVGKSTLVRILAGNDEKYNGNIRYNESLKLLYFDFDSISKLPGSETVLSFIQNDEPSEFRAKTLLGMMMFGGDDYDKKIRVLSGGEKIRLYLTKLFISKFNYIILDEPTNYLDIDTIDIFIKWLEGLKTGFIIVSHNEYLLKSVKSDEMWEINNGKLHIHFGNYRDYISYQKNLIVDYEEKSFLPINKINKKSNRQQIVNKRIEINKKIKDIEEQISQLENERDEIFKMLTDTDIYKKDSENVRKNRKREREITLLLEALYLDWNKLIESMPILD